jgi:xeroderma pigmentosum group C-complementing protein
MMGLRIRERIWSGVGEEERQQADKDAEFEAWAKGAESDETEEFDMVVDEDDGGGGGFLVGEGDADGDEGGGFLVE